MLNKKINFSIILSLFATACASVPMHSKVEDQNAKQFKPSADKGKIYIYRNEMLGGITKIKLSLDGRSMGANAPKTFHVWEVEPGNHEVTCGAENSDNLKLNIEKGKIYYIWQEMKMGMVTAGCMLHNVTERKGQKGVLGCSLAKSGLLDE